MTQIAEKIQLEQSNQQTKWNNSSGQLPVYQQQQKGAPKI